HGRAGADSHLALPRVEASLEALRARDFVPFKALNDLPMAMTAHVVYSAIDPEHPSTTSSRVIEDIIRGEIGFDGLLMSDDISMKALSGDYGARTSAILAAGCDVVLHCNGAMAEMRAVAQRTPALSGKALLRAERALAAAGVGERMDETALRAEFLSLITAAV
ncbi:glycoside hydrolase family 3 N-terminal domain-containing protein, partial [Nitratireductor sp. GCM10026969]|uniref:glycoside hydrolase family 3 N-terminal domain-containing protein n=1 Tax=Nitratireductor sp. GCM10026969 TaxID=3252645 RepID=UPI00360D667D